MERGLLKGWTDPAAVRRRPPELQPEQLVLYPRQTQFVLPYEVESKEIFQYVEADNGRRYYLKVDLGDRPLRANELLGYRISALVGVDTPRCEFIQTEDGDIAFGSEAISDVASAVETQIYLEQPSCTEFGMSLNGLQAGLTAIHVLDLFLCNVDRHFRNFLIVGEGLEKQLLALDFARAGFWRWPWRGFLQPGDGSMIAWRELRERHGFDTSVAELTLGRLAAISPAQIEVILHQMPPHWLPASLRSEFLTYCRDGGWAARVDRLREGLGNGAIV